MKKHVPTVLSIVSCLLIAVCLFQIADLKEQVSMLQGSLSGQIASVDSSVNSIYPNINALLEEQDNLLSAGTWEFGEADFSALTVEVTYSVTPKEYAAGTKAAIVVDGIEHPMSLSSGAFVASIDAPLFAEANASKVIFREGETIRTEALDWHISARYDYLPHIYTDFIGGTTGRQSGGAFSYHFEGVINVNVDCTPSYEVKSVTFVEMMNGEEIGRTNIPLDNADFYENYETKNGAMPEQPARPVSMDGDVQTGPFYYNLDKKYEIPLGGSLTLYVEVADGYGLTHRSLIAREEINKSGEPIDGGQWRGGMESSIYDANGKALFEPYPSLYQ